MACKNGDLYCGTHWDCGKCTREMNEAAMRRLTPAQREYDRLALAGWPDDDREPEGCSCHINPPCSYCTRDIDEDPVTGGKPGATE